jgi:hypothetical protein
LAAPTEVNASIPVTISGTPTVTANVINAQSAQTVASSAANPYAIAANTIGLIMEGPVHQLWRVANDAQACYAQAIRSKLSFT